MDLYLLNSAYWRAADGLWFRLISGVNKPVAYRAEVELNELGWKMKLHKYF